MNTSKVTVYFTAINKSTKAQRYHIYDGKDHTIVKKQPDEGFYMFDNFETTKEGLEDFHKKLLKWAADLKNDSTFKFDYLKDNIGHKFFLKQGYSQIIKKMSKMNIDTESVTYDEFLFFQRCYNGGFMVADQYEGRVKGYDFKSFYPNIMANNNLMIPVKEGEFVDLEELPKKIPFGIYNVKITSYHPKVKFLFAFSKKSHYTHYDLTFARYLKSKGFIDTIELQHPEDEYNSLIYSEECLVSSKDLCGPYFRLLMAKKDKYKGNQLIKYALNKMWGYMTRKTSPYYIGETTYSAKSEEQQEEYQILDLKYCKSGKTMYKVVKKNKLYMTPYRLGPFLTAFARKKMANKILDISVDKCVRVHTDGVMFEECNQVVNKSTRAFEDDDKHSGYFKITNVMKFEKITS